MIEIKGKYNEAKIFIDNVDSETYKQVLEMCNKEELKDCKIRIMPDCHAGKGCTIGTTMTIGKYINVNYVGVDIGCGVAFSIIDKKDLEINEKVFNQIAAIITRDIPLGFKIHEKSKREIMEKKYNLYLETLKCYNELSETTIDRSYKSLGSLGGGNHYIEIGENENSYMISVHSGSRNLGFQVALVYNNKADENGFISGDFLKDYLHDMDFCMKYAKANREEIINILLNRLNINAQVLHTVHNYIDVEENILRKGAVSCKKDEMLVIPINMRDGVILAKGKGNSDWNYSSPHGAGRILSRGKAKEILSMDDFKKEMKGIYTLCIKESTLDESPMAYKSIDDILDNIQDTFDVISIYKPIFNHKG